MGLKDIMDRGWTGKKYNVNVQEGDTAIVRDAVTIGNVSLTRGQHVTVGPSSKENKEMVEVTYENPDKSNWYGREIRVKANSKFKKLEGKDFEVLEDLVTRVRIRHYSRKQWWKYFLNKQGLQLLPQKGFVKNQICYGQVS